MRLNEDFTTFLSFTVLEEEKREKEKEKKAEKIRSNLISSKLITI